jgi:hypothetical protein
VNRSFTLETGDAIRVLRAVVGLDPQPQLAPSVSFKKSRTAAPVGPVDPLDVSVPGVLVADKSTAAPGEKITVEVRLTSEIAAGGAISGASFRLNYPAEALKLENTSSHAVGSLVPSGAMTVWNVAPNQNNFATQNGAVSFAVSSGASWPNSSGVLARLTFTVQPGATARYGWPLELENLEVSRDGFIADTIGNAGWTFTGHMPTGGTLAPNVTFAADGKPIITLQGDRAASFVIESSDDLQTWSPVGTVYSSDGTVTIQDSMATASSARFYRAIQLPN